MLPPFTPGCTGSLHPDVKDGNMGVFTELSACFCKKKRRLLWNEEPYFVNLIPIIFVFTFVYSIILYAFSKVTEGNMLVSNHMIKRPVSGVIEAVIEENLLYHCLKRLNINSYNLRGDRVIEDLQETSYVML